VTATKPTACSSDRLRARRGAKKAIVAVAASMLTAIHVMLARGVAYRDLGADHFERTNKERLAARLMRTLKQLGYTVALTPMNPASLFHVRGIKTLV
jgi:transposase